MAFWIGLAVLGFVVTVLIIESRPVRSRLEKWSGAGDAGASTRSGFWGGWYSGGDGGFFGDGGNCGGDGGGGGGGDGGGGGC